MGESCNNGGRSSEQESSLRMGEGVGGGRASPGFRRNEQQNAKVAKSERRGREVEVAK